MKTSKKIFLTIVALFCTCSWVEAQDLSDKQAKLVIILPESKLESAKGKNRPVFLIPEENQYIKKGTLETHELDKLDIILYDLKDPSKNAEFTFDKIELDNDIITINYDGDDYRIIEEDNHFSLRKIQRGPASGSSSNIKLKTQKSFHLPFECKNHTPPDRYDNPNDVKDTCCFTIGCK